MRVAGHAECLVVCRRSGRLELFNETFERIFTCRNVHEGMAIMRNDAYLEQTREELHRPAMDVTSPIDTSYIPLSAETRDQQLTIAETLLADVNGKTLLLVPSLGSA